MSTLDQMQAFVTVVEEGSFTAAALQFDISPTAMSKKVLHEYKLSCSLIEDKNSHLSGTLHILCMREVAQKLVFPSMAIFLEQYPCIVTNVTVKKLASDITLMNYDIAIVMVK